MSDKTVVDPRNSAMKNSPVAGPVSDEATVIIKKASTTCHWNDQPFPEGALVECDGVTYECNYGQWVEK